MKHTIKLPVALLTVGLIFTACTDSKKDNTSSTEMSDTMTTTNSPMQMGDTAAGINTTTSIAALSPEQDFINYAVPGNTNEIIWLKAGVQKGSKEVKDHASMMLKDHEALGTKVKGYLGGHKDLVMPALDTTNAVNINDKMGADWNKAWANKMVEDHTGLLEKLKTSSTTVKDPALLAIINPTIKTVESHLAMAKMLQGKMK